MKLHRRLLIAVALLTLSACEQQSSVNHTDGLRDAFDARPHERIRDAGERIGAAVEDAGRDIRKAVNDN